jgi:hypothetical protein
MYRKSVETEPGKRSRDAFGENKHGGGTEKFTCSRSRGQLEQWMKRRRGKRTKVGSADNDL